MSYLSSMTMASRYLLVWLAVYCSALQLATTASNLLLSIVRWPYAIWWSERGRKQVETLWNSTPSCFLSRSKKEIVCNCEGGGSGVSEVSSLVIGSTTVYLSITHSKVWTGIEYGCGSLTLAPDNKYVFKGIKRSRNRAMSSPYNTIATCCSCK